MTMSEKEKQTLVEKVKAIGQKMTGKKKLLLLTAGAAGIVAVSVVAYTTSRKEDSWGQMMGQMGQRPSVSGNNIMNTYVTASGTTSLGYTMDEFEPDYIETELYIEEVYLSSGDEVEAGTAVFKVSDESIAKARAELEEKKEETSLAYRAGVISYEQSKINAKYTYDAAVLEGKQAEAVYQSAVKSAEKKLQTAKDNVADTESKLEEYQDANADYYYDYNVDEYKERYETNFSFYHYLIGLWGIGENEIGGSSSGMGSGSTTGSGSGMGSGSTTGSGSGMETGSGAGEQPPAMNVSSAKEQEEQNEMVLALFADWNTTLKTLDTKASENEITFVSTSTVSEPTVDEGDTKATPANEGDDNTPPSNEPGGDDNTSPSNEPGGDDNMPPSNEPGGDDNTSPSNEPGGDDRFSFLR